MARRIYSETFDDGPGGWFGWISNQGGPKALEWTKGSVTSRSPWWIDYNHAPPGAGYLHMLFVLLTAGRGHGESILEAGGDNRFTANRFPTDFRNARLTVRVRGELETRGAQLRLLVQGRANDICSGWVLTESPIHVTPDWTEQTIVLTTDPDHWVCLDSRHDRTETYGTIPLQEILANVNANILFVMFPLDVVPMGPIGGDPHILRPGRDYPVWTSRLPEGYVVLGSVAIEFDA